MLIGAVVAGSAVYAQSDFSGDRFRAHVTFLADDVLEGREAGTRGHEIAARYIASQFALLGVRPGATGGGYFERVNLQEARLTGASPTLTLTGPRGTQTLKQREAIMVDPRFTGAFNTLGVIYKRHGNDPEAERVMRFVLSREPENANAMANAMANVSSRSPVRM